MKIARSPVAGIGLIENLFAIVFKQQICISEVPIFCQELLKSHLCIHALLDCFRYQMDEENGYCFMVAHFNLQANVLQIKTWTRVRTANKHNNKTYKHHTRTL